MPIPKFDNGEFDDFELPDFEYPVPAVAPEPKRPAQRQQTPRRSVTSPQESARRAEKRQQPPVRRAPARPVQKTPVENTDDAFEAIEDTEYTTDPKTGIRYKKLLAMSPEVIAAHKRTKGAGLSVSELRSMVDDIEEIDPNDPTEAAKMFMPHLRIPPNEDEINSLIAERERLERERKRKHAQEVAELDEKLGSLEKDDDPYDLAKPKKGGFFSKLFKK